MDDAALRDRRAARARGVRRRRRLGLAGGLALAAAVAAVLLLTSGGADSRDASGTEQSVGSVHTDVYTVSTRSVVPPRARRVAAAMPGAHLAPHEPVPILMYHVIGERPAGAPNSSLWVSPRDFRSHVRALKRAGYHGVTLQQVWNGWHANGKLPRKPIVFSFDDGYAGQVRFALPALRRAGWPGVLNLELNNLEGMGGTKAVKKLTAAGWEIDSHTLTHPDLTTLGPADLRREVAVSRARLRRLFRKAVRFFCYPSGHYDDAVIAAVRAAGYRAATTTQAGWAAPEGDPFTLPRLRIDAGVPASGVLSIVRGARPAAAG